MVQLRSLLLLFYAICFLGFATLLIKGPSSTEVLLSLQSTNTAAYRLRQHPDGSFSGSIAETIGSSVTVTTGGITTIAATTATTDDCYLHPARSKRCSASSRQQQKGVQIIRLWSSDFHISPIADIKNLLGDFYNSTHPRSSSSDSSSSSIGSGSSSGGSSSGGIGSSSGSSIGNGGGSGSSYVFGGSNASSGNNGVESRDISSNTTTDTTLTTTITNATRTAATIAVEITDKSLSGHCHLTGSCQRDLRVINQANGIALSPCTNHLRRAFYASYRGDAQLLQMDAFLCNHAASMCELFMPFGKPLIVIASTRYEIGRLSAAQWRRWNHNLKLIAASPHNTIAANNKYDQEYIKYFTGIEDVMLLPSYCNYVGVKYTRSTLPQQQQQQQQQQKQTSSINTYLLRDKTMKQQQQQQLQQHRSEFLLAPSRGVDPRLQRELFAALDTFNRRTTSTRQQQQQQEQQQQPQQQQEQEDGGSRWLQIVPIRTLYPRYEFIDLARHPAVVLLPYQLSLMSLFEFYRMELPLFVPSPLLLTRWHQQLNVLKERTWSGVYNAPVRQSVLPRHWNSSSALFSDPNNEFDSDAILDWVKLADFYQWPHIQQFDDWDELFEKLARGENSLLEISRNMSQFNQQQQADLLLKWSVVIARVSKNKQQRSQEVVQQLPVDIDQQLMKLYNYTLSKSDCTAQVYA